jgi:hypothetical protein
MASLREGRWSHRSRLFRRASTVQNVAAVPPSSPQLHCTSPSRPPNGELEHADSQRHVAVGLLLREPTCNYF